MSLEIRDIVAYKTRNVRVDRGLDIKWDCTTRVDKVDRELLSEMKKAGCYNIDYGIESGSQEVLNYMKKHITLEQSRRAVKLSKELGIKTHLFMMLGFPIEDRKTIQQTIDFAKELDGDSAQFNVVTAFPGVDLRKIVEEEGLLVEKDWSKTFTKWPTLRTRYLSSEELYQLRIKAFDEIIRANSRRNFKLYLRDPRKFIKKAKEGIANPKLSIRFFKDVIQSYLRD